MAIGSAQLEQPLFGLKPAVFAIRAHRVGDEMIDRLLKIDHGGRLQIGELGPDDGVEEPAIDSQLNGRPPLARLAIGAKPVLATKSDEQADRPDIRQRELQLHLLRCGTARRRVAKLAAQSIDRRVGGVALARRSRALEQGLQLGEPRNLRIVHCGHALFRKVETVAARTALEATMSTQAARRCPRVANPVASAHCEIRPTAGHAGRQVWASASNGPHRSANVAEGIALDVRTSPNRVGFTIEVFKAALGQERSWKCVCGKAALGSEPPHLLQLFRVGECFSINAAYEGAPRDFEAGE